MGTLKAGVQQMEHAYNSASPLWPCAATGAEPVLIVILVLVS